MRWHCFFLCSLGLWLPAAVLADAAERDRIAAERQRLIERFTQEELACQQRFFVNACVEDVRRRRSEALAPLRARELELDDAERQRRAAERRSAIEAKQRELAARPAPASAPALPPLQPARPTSASPVASAASASQQSSAEAQARAAKAAERARASQRRREETEAALERVRRRVAEREAAGQAGAPLPLPEAASAPER